MQEIDFRGRSLQTGEWVYGYYYEHQPPMQCKTSKDYVPEKPKSYILQTGFADWNMPRPVDFIEVDPKTLGQYTGQDDKNGIGIYEGDITKADIYGKEFAGLVQYSQGLGLYYLSGMARSDTELWICEEKEVIGNIHDNPELLEVE